MDDHEPRPQADLESEETAAFPDGPSEEKKESFDAGAFYRRYRVTIAPQETADFVEGDLSRIKCECCDGRGEVLFAERDPAYRRFGGVLGNVVNLLAAANELCYIGHDLFDEVWSLIDRKFGGMTFHSDDHSGGAVTGCGFIRFAFANPTEYGLTTVQAEEIADRVKKLPHDRALILTGTHEEKAVIISDEASVLPRPRSASDTQVFVVNRFFDNAALKVLTNELATKLALSPEVLFASALRHRDAQAGLTAAKLGADKLPTAVIAAE